MKKLVKALCILAVFTAVMTFGNYLISINVRVARIVSYTGQCDVQRSSTNEWIPAENDMRLYEGDTVKTRSKSKVIIQLDDGSLTQLTSLSTMTMDRLSRSLKGKNTNMEMDVGKAWMKVKKLAESKDKFNVTTPTAVAGVRGTYFSTEVEQSDDSTFDVFEGAVSVYQKEDPSAPVEVRSNHRTEVNKNALPTAPSTIPQEDLQKGLSDGIQGALDPEKGSFDLKIDVNPPVIPAGGKATVVVQFLENGKAYNGAVTFTLNLGGSAVFDDNNAKTLEVTSNEKGYVRVTISDPVREEVSITADVAFETKE